MGYFCCKTHVTHLLNLLHQLIFYPISLVSTKHGLDGEDESRPSPSLVPVPFTTTNIVMLKEKLRVVEFGEFLDKSATRSSQDGCGGEPYECAICLNSVARKQEIRELTNCAHVYHKECLDGWLEQGSQTCPLCRVRVLPALAPRELDVNHDPWRWERMVYLFGEDCSF